MPCEPDASTHSVLPGATFKDCFRIRVDGYLLTAAEAAERSLSNPPLWVSTLMSTRDRLVGIFGLRGLDKTVSDPARQIGMFPVVTQSVERVVLGFDDKHLDFRIVIDVAQGDNATDVRATTLVLPHHWGGKAYLAAVMPFHKRIVPVMLEAIARN